MPGLKLNHVSNWGFCRKASLLHDWWSSDSGLEETFLCLIGLSVNVENRVRDNRCWRGNLAPVLRCLLADRLPYFERILLTYWYLRKWSSFCRRYFQFHFSHREPLANKCYFNEICFFRSPIHDKSAFILGNVLVPDRREVITLPNDDADLWCHMTPQGQDELK